MKELLKHYKEDKEANEWGEYQYTNNKGLTYNVLKQRKGYLNRIKSIKDETKEETP